MTDSVDKLSAAVGLSREALVEIAKQVQANHAKLNACPYHEFALIPGEGDPAKLALKRRYRCAHCGGEVDGIAYLWHERGRRPQPGS